MEFGRVVVDAELGLDQFPAAFISAPEMSELPPTAGIFSSRTTLAPAFLAVMAAEKPAPPAPITTTS